MAQIYRKKTNQKTSWQMVGTGVIISYILYSYIYIVYKGNKWQTE